MTVRVRLPQGEAAQLNTLAGELVELLTEPDTQDAAVARLVPDAYQNAEDAAEFRRLTQDDLLERRRADAEAMRASLRVDGREIVAADLSPARAARKVTIALDEAQVAAWLRTLTALRLVLAERLGVLQEGEDTLARAPYTDRNVMLYDWLGYRQELLLESLDG